ncbi:aminoglycoside phosphotransferase family protein [Halobacillus litoralis]|uniref:phosphotransferase family protein n=1 Tax=Halobacillus litoralis TaxID=45668 RepID=UPI001CD6F0C6|nr:aminoglycoside phosphotransferase family protein [Halobacillus litoralis]MCA0969211.1 aminoglycoside phosphotransferase family protein [Halobacillus litoralis]
MVGVNKGSGSDQGEYIARGNTADVFRKGNRIWKVFKEYLPDGEAHKEAEKQSLVHSMGVPVPEVYGITSINGRQAIEMEFLQGDTLGDLFLASPERQQELLITSIQIQKKIHSMKVEGLESMSDKLHNQITALNDLDESRKERLLEKLTIQAGGRMLCHGDFHLHNIICTKPEYTIIDWVDATVGSPLADVSRTYLLYLSFSRELADRYLDLYCKGSEVDIHDIHQWTPIMAAGRLSEGVETDDRNRLMDMITMYTD